MSILDVDVLQGNVATRRPIRYGGSLNYHFIANFLENLLVIFLKIC